MPRSWPGDAVHALNHHHELLGGNSGAYNVLLGEYTGSLALGVPWARQSTMGGELQDSSVSQKCFSTLNCM